jgi:hypothetical protein
LASIEWKWAEFPSRTQCVNEEVVERTTVKQRAVKGLKLGAISNIIPPFKMLFRQSTFLRNFGDLVNLALQIRMDLFWANGT